MRDKERKRWAKEGDGMIQESLLLSRFGAWLPCAQVGTLVVVSCREFQMQGPWRFFTHLSNGVSGTSARVFGYLWTNGKATFFPYSCHWRPVSLPFSLFYKAVCRNQFLKRFRILKRLAHLQLYTCSLHSLHLAVNEMEQSVVSGSELPFLLETYLLLYSISLKFWTTRSYFPFRQLKKKQANYFSFFLCLLFRRGHSPLLIFITNFLDRAAPKLQLEPLTVH